jgi:ketosteroid isomerase-like protein
MSQENVEIVRRMLDAFLAGDADAAATAFDPEMAWDASAYPFPDLPQGGGGRDAYLRAVAAYAAAWPGYEATLAEVISAENDVVVVLHETIRAAGGHLPLERDLFAVYTVHDRRISLVRFYKTRKEALEAAGLRA